MSDQHIVVVNKNRFYLARKRAGMDESYVVIAEAMTESSAETMARLLNAQAPVQRPS